MPPLVVAPERIHGFTHWCNMVDLLVVMGRDRYLPLWDSEPVNDWEILMSIHVIDEVVTIGLVLFITL